MNTDIIKGNVTDIFDLFLKYTQEIFVVTDTALNILLFNSAASKATREFYGKELKAGVPVLEFVLPEYISEIKSVLEDALTGKSRTVKYSLADHKTLSLTILPSWNQGEIRYIIISCIDISNEEKTLQSLSLQQQLLQRAERIAGIGSWEWDIPSDKVVWSDALYEFFGLKPGEVSPTKELGLSFIHPEDIERANEVLLHSYITGEPYNAEIRFIAKTGELKYIQCQGIIIRNELGRNEKIIGTFHDITQNKLLVDSINKQEQRFRSLIENSSDLIIQVNENREIIYVSSAISSMMQYAPEDVLGKRLATLACPEDLPWMMQEFEKLLKTPGVPHVFQYRVIRKDGSYLWVEGTVTSLFHVPGVKSVVINQRDISMRKAAEMELVELEMKMSAERLKRQQEITAAVITAQEQEREELGRELHDNINQILATTRLYIEYAQTHDEKRDELLNAAKGFIISAVNGIRDLSKSLSPPSLGEVGLIMALEELVESIHAVKKLTFHTEWGDIDEELIPEQLKLTLFRIIQEQLNNIIRHAKANNTWIKIKMQNGRLLLSVKDDGKGFNIIEKSKGVGLKNISSRAGLHNGTMKMHSEPGQGCELKVAFSL